MPRIQAGGAGAPLIPTLRAAHGVFRRAQDLLLADPLNTDGFDAAVPLLSGDTTSNPPAGLATMTGSDAARPDIPLVTALQTVDSARDAALNGIASDPLRVNCCGPLIPVIAGQGRSPGTRSAALPVRDVRRLDVPLVAANQTPHGMSRPRQDRLITHPLEVGGGSPSVPLLGGYPRSTRGSTGARWAPLTSAHVVRADVPLVAASRAARSMGEICQHRLIANPLNIDSRGASVPLFSREAASKARRLPPAGRAPLPLLHTIRSGIPLMPAREAARGMLGHDVYRLIADPLDANSSSAAVPLLTAYSRRHTRSLEAEGGRKRGGGWKRRLTPPAQGALHETER